MKPFVITTKNFADIAISLNALAKKKQEFECVEECQKTINILKNKLISTEVLKYPDYSKPFILTTDASNVALEQFYSKEILEKTDQLMHQM